MLGYDTAEGASCHIIGVVQVVGRIPPKGHIRSATWQCLFICGQIAVEMVLAMQPSAFTV